MSKRKKLIEGLIQKVTRAPKSKIDSFVNHIVAVFETRLPHRGDISSHACPFAPKVYYETKASAAEFNALLTAVMDRAKRDWVDVQPSLVWALGASHSDKMCSVVLELLEAAVRDGNEDLAWQCYIAADNIGMSSDNIELKRRIYESLKRLRPAIRKMSDRFEDAFGNRKKFEEWWGLALK